MAEYKKQTSTGGAWVKKDELRSGIKAKIVSETNPEASQHTNKDGSVKYQDVCRVRFEGAEESVKVALNRATINALVDAFGEDSKKWMGQVLTAETEKMRVGGKAVIALYLIPAGYRRTDDTEGYAVIVKDEGEPVINIDEKGEVKEEDLPF